MSHLSDSRGFPHQPSPGAMRLCGKPAVCSSGVPEKMAESENIRQMSGQVSLGSAGEYQADEPAGVARLSWRVSGR